MLLYLVRHGQTDLNQENIIQGQLDTPLSDLGEEQAQKLSQWLKLVPFTEAWSSPLKRAEQTAKIICSKQAKCNNKVNTDERLKARNYGELQGKNWEEVKKCDLKQQQGSKGIESEEELSARLHDWLSILIETHTPITSSTSTPITPLLTQSQGQAQPDFNEDNKPILQRALSSIKGLPRPGISRNSSISTRQNQFGKSIVLCVTHQECLSSLIKILTKSNINNDNSNDDDKVSKKSPIDLHVPETISLDNKVGNTSVAILRIWWEDDEVNGGLEPRGRLEAWGSEEHLQDDE
ncbi:uncharacterized protein L201_000504 [Kwoniella dendrophila CBS 6074]|uniref:Phosphoglycerate mutase n=1 Tax=Kwoniella dendrophila CBS 6074 TaxID=1295534 RepID=A0AAX4JL64_9TREE